MMSAVQNLEKLLNNLEFLWCEITLRCNLRCVHCYASSSPYLPVSFKLFPEDWEQILNDAYLLGCRKVQFIGGEPTLYPWLPRLLRYTHSKGYEFVEVFTNATNISDEMWRLFKENEVHLAISLYGPSSEIHDKITMQRGSFNKTVKSIQRAIEINIPLRIAVVVMEENSGHIEETQSFLKDLGVVNIRVDRVRGIGRGYQKSPNNDPFNELCGACWKGTLVIDSKGDAFPCVFSRFYELGNIHNGLRSVLNYDLVDFRVKVFKRNANLKPCAPPICSPGCGPTCSPPCGPYCAPK